MSQTDNHTAMDTDTLLRRFRAKFGRPSEDTDAERVFHAPGRVNLIGDHTDYTGGLVFPCGIDRGSHLVIRRNATGRFRFASTNFELMGDLHRDEIDRKWGDTWINYPLGVIDQFRRRGIEAEGVDCLFSGDIPNGAGLSSSASIEVVTAVGLNALLDAGLDNLELVRLAQQAEHDFVGMQCGIMDQFAVAMAEADHAILLDCHSLEYRQVPLQLEDHALVVINTNQRRELNESAYNERVAECARALDLLAPHTGISRLGELTPEALDTHKACFAHDAVAFSRARHVATENERVQNAVPALEAGNLIEFGRLMNASHDSLASDYGVSSVPLDTLVSAARATDSVLGARLTGAGFGGCTVNLVAQDALAHFERSVGLRYREATGLTADFYRVSPGAGARVVEID